MHKIYKMLRNRLIKRQKAIRSRFIGRKLYHLGKDTYIHPSVNLGNPKRISIGKEVKLQRGIIIRPGKYIIYIGSYSGINPYVTIYGKVNIGKYAMIAPHVMIAGGNHAFDYISGPMIKSGKGSNKGIIIGDDVWIGANSVILDGVKIGDGAVVGAGSVVNSDLEPYSISAGNPVKFIRSRKFKDS